MKVARVLRMAMLMGLGLLGACVARTPYPAEWNSKAMTDDWCQRPSGRFENLPVQSTEEASRALRTHLSGRPFLALTEIFFGDHLADVDVTHVAFETLDSGELRVTPWVDATMLPEERIIKPAGSNCERSRWRVRSGWDMDGYMLASGLIITGGTVLPAATQVYFSLELDRAGGLIVHLITRTAGTLVFFFPFRVRDGEGWLLYAPHAPGEEGAHDAAEASLTVPGLR